MDAVIEQLKTKKGYDKNKYLRENKDFLDMRLQLDRQILDLEYQIQKSKMELAALKSKRELFDYYDDGNDPY